MKTTQKLTLDDQSYSTPGLEGAQAYFLGVHVAKAVNESDRLPLSPAIVIGVVSGSMSNIAALLMGQPIWVGLLCHSGFGFVGMAAYYVSLWRLSVQRQTD